MAAPTDARSTRDLLIDTAERLFAERGIDAVSLRAVGQQAGQRNNSVAQYHFRSREGLVEAIITARSAPIEERRAELVASLRGAEPVVRDVVGVFVRPLAEWLESAARPTAYLRFLAQVIEQEGAEHLSTQQPGLRWMHRELRRLLPDQSPATFARRQRWLAQVTLRVLADQERELAAGSRRVAPMAEVVDDLLTMLVALLEA